MQNEVNNTDQWNGVQIRKRKFRDPPVKQFDNCATAFTYVGVHLYTQITEAKVMIFDINKIRKFEL
jgi:hypothetical protein